MQRQMLGLGQEPSSPAALVCLSPGDAAGDVTSAPSDAGDDGAASAAAAAAAAAAAMVGALERGGGQVVVSWAGPTELGQPQLHKYQLERLPVGLPGAAWQAVMDVDAEAHPGFVDEVMPGTYRYRLAAWNVHGRSAWAVSNDCWVSDLRSSGGGSGSRPHSLLDSGVALDAAAAAAAAAVALPNWLLRAAEGAVREGSSDAEDAPVVDQRRQPPAPPLGGERDTGQHAASAQRLQQRGGAASPRAPVAALAPAAAAASGRRAAATVVVVVPQEVGTIAGGGGGAIAPTLPLAGAGAPAGAVLLTANFARSAAAAANGGAAGVGPGGAAAANQGAATAGAAPSAASAVAATVAAHVGRWLWALMNSFLLVVVPLCVRLLPLPLLARVQQTVLAGATRLVGGRQRQWRGQGQEASSAAAAGGDVAAGAPQGWSGTGGRTARSEIASQFGSDVSFGRSTRSHLAGGSVSGLASFWPHSNLSSNLAGGSATIEAMAAAGAWPAGAPALAAAAAAAGPVDAPAITSAAAAAPGGPAAAFTSGSAGAAAAATASPVAIRSSNSTQSLQPYAPAAAATAPDAARPAAPGAAAARGAGALGRALEVPGGQGGSGGGGGGAAARRLLERGFDLSPDARIGIARSGSDSNVQALGKVLSWQDLSLASMYATALERGAPGAAAAAAAAAAAGGSGRGWGAGIGAAGVGEVGGEGAMAQGSGGSMARRLMVGWAQQEAAEIMPQQQLMQIQQRREGALAPMVAPMDGRVDKKRCAAPG